MVALLPMAACAEVSEEGDNKEGSGGSPSWYAPNGSLAGLVVKRGRMSMLVGFTKGGITSIAGNGRRPPGQKARTRSRVERVSLLMVGGAQEGRCLKR
jgi:hypothetical protein